VKDVKRLVQTGSSHWIALKFGCREDRPSQKLGVSAKDWSRSFRSRENMPLRNQEQTFGNTLFSAALSKLESLFALQDSCERIHQE